MTSEVLIMNESGVALAADSAATIMNKVYKADKLFELSRTQPIGLMIYGTSAIDTIPVELLVTEFRRRIGEKRFDTLEECAETFLAFLGRCGSFDTGEYPVITTDHMDFFIGQSLDFLIRRLNSRISNGDYNYLVPEGNADSVFDVVLSHLESESKQGIEAKDRNLLLKEVTQSVKRSAWFEKLKHQRIWKDAKLRRRMLNLYVNSILSGDGFEMATGVVITGFGDKEYLPSYREYHIHGVFPNGLCYALVSESRIDHRLRSSIETFAQDDVMKTFMDGIDPYLFNMIADGLERTMNDVVNIFSRFVPEDTDWNTLMDATRKVSDGFLQDVQDSMSLDYRFPMESAVGVLSKDDMCVLAESLIQSTSLRRHVSRDMETVGGPVDVAFISRNEGFIWVKRKHYFNTEMNLSYMERRRLE